MPINERGEFIRDADALNTEGDADLKKLKEQDRALAATQDEEPESARPISDEKRVAILKRLLG